MYTKFVFFNVETALGAYLRQRTETFITYRGVQLRGSINGFYLALNNVSYIILCNIKNVIGIVHLNLDSKL